MPQNLYRQTDRSDGDELGVDAVRKISRKILTVVGDPKMHPTIAVKAARAIVDRKISPNEIVDLCDTITAKRARGELESPGAYFCAVLKRLFQRNEIPWRSPRRGTSSDWQDLF